MAAPRLSDTGGQIQVPWWEGSDDRQLRHVLDAGLGALLYHATRDRLERAPPAWRDALKSADLTAQVRYGNLCDTADEVIDVCQEMGVRVTLLKGISDQRPALSVAAPPTHGRHRYPGAGTRRPVD